MESIANSVLVAGIDVAEDRFEGQVYLIGPGMLMAPVGHTPMFVGVIGFLGRALAPAFSSDVSCCQLTSGRLWLRRKKGRSAR